MGEWCGERRISADTERRWGRDPSFEKRGALQTRDLTRHASDLAKPPSGVKDAPTRTQALGGVLCRSRGVIF
jgi:hypothetical protein